MWLCGLYYEHENVLPFDDGKRDLARVNPIARVPVLELPDGGCLVDSTAIIDYLDEIAGHDHALIPRAGSKRRQVLKFVAIELGIMDKLVAVLYERQFRPKEKWHRPWIAACEAQIRDGFNWIDNEINDDWIISDQMTQADISLAVFWDFATRTRPCFFADFNCKDINKIAEKLHNFFAFQQTLAVEEGLSAETPECPEKEANQ